jgi:RNA polymerase sigma-70 factor (ECF subfamily)
MGVSAAALDSLIWMFSSIVPGRPEAIAPAEFVSHQQDLELVRRLLAGDRKAMADFVADHADAIYGYVRFRLAPRADSADDVLQEVFLAAWQNLASYRGTSPMRAWLMGIARHKIEDIYRRRLIEPDPLPEDGDVSGLAGGEDLLDAEIDRKRLRDRASAILEELPGAYSAVLLWRYWEHRSTAEMAAATGKTEKAIERLLDRARKSFRARWQDGGR